MEKVSSAVETVFPPGVFITTMPRLRGRVHVHVVHPHAGAADDQQIRRGGDDVLVDLGFRADDQGVGVLDQRQQFGLRHLLLEHGDFELFAPLQQRDAFRRNRVTNENIHKGAPV